MAPRGLQGVLGGARPGRRMAQPCRSVRLSRGMAWLPAGRPDRWIADYRREVAKSKFPRTVSHLRLLNKRIVDTEFFTEGSYVSHILLAPDPPIWPVEGAERACHMRPEHRHRGLCHGRARWSPYRILRSCRGTCRARVRQHRRSSWRWPLVFERHPLAPWCDRHGRRGTRARR